MVTIKVDKQVILDAIEDDVYNFIEPISKILKQTQYEDIMIDKLVTTQSLEKLADTLIKKDLYRELNEEIDVQL